VIEMAAGDTTVGSTPITAGGSAWLKASRNMTIWKSGLPKARSSPCRALPLKVMPNLYHLNAMEEPYQADYPKAPKYPRFHERFGPRNILDTKATDVDDPTTDPRWGKVGKQTIADGGPLPPHPNMDSAAKTNMEDIEPVLVQRSLDFIDRSVKADKPFFLWHNSTRCHVWTHLSPKWKDKSGYGLYADG